MLLIFPKNNVSQIIMSPSISIIVPVYKAEAYLHRCVDSLLAQKFTDFEVLLIDDGSPDRSGEICDDYARKDARVRVFHQTNGGVSVARQRGVENANGEWITFVDADDYLPQKSLQTMHLLVEKYETDLVVGATLNDKRMKTIGDELAIADYRKLLIEEKITASPWAKLIRRVLFTPFVFDMPRQIVFGEDLLMNIRLAYQTNKNIAICKDYVYEYVQNQTSCMHTFKMTLDYAEMYFKEKERSVGEIDKDKSVRWSIKHKFRFLEKIIKDCAFSVNRNFYSHSFLKTLERNIAYSHYKCSEYECILKKNHSKYIYIFAYCLKHFIKA